MQPAQHEASKLGRNSLKDFFFFDNVWRFLCLAFLDIMILIWCWFKNKKNYMSMLTATCWSRRARRAAAPGECRRPLLPAGGQGQVSPGGGHPATDAGGSRRVEPQNGRGTKVFFFFFYITSHWVLFVHLCVYSHWWSDGRPSSHGPSLL